MAHNGMKWLVIAALLLSISGTGVTATAGENSQHNATLIDTENVGAYDLAIDGDYVVWSSLQHPYDPREHRREQDYGVNLYDLATGEMTLLSANPANQNSPVISGDRVVWEDDRTHGTTGIDLYLYNITSGTETPVCTRPGDQQFPVISGDIIAWQETPSRQTGRIYYYSIPAGTEAAILTDQLQSRPFVAEDCIFYIAGSGAERGIYRYGVPSGIESPVFMTNAILQILDVTGDRIVWLESTSGIPWQLNEIHLFNCSTGEDSVVIADPVPKKNADMDGTRIVWEYSERGSPFEHNGSDIYCTELTRGESFPLYVGRGNQVHPAISGDQVVWFNFHPEEQGLYLYEFEPEVEETLPLPTEEPDEEETAAPGFGTIAGILALTVVFFGVRWHRR
ncbi:MAG: hypothetical protein JXA08_00630 [Methanomicrobiaceae archaeon]|nr:hypothetical protein [Methanomicrobiaceae archaeon]